MIFPNPIKIELVRVRKPLNFFGELSPRYIRCTLRPRPVEEGKKKKKVEKNQQQKLSLTKTKHIYCTLSEHTNIISIEKSSQQDHLKRFGHSTKEHEESSDNRHDIVDQESFFPEKSQTKQNKTKQNKTNKKTEYYMAFTEMCLLRLHLIYENIPFPFVFFTFYFVPP